MSIAQFHQEVSKGMPAPAYLLHATDEFLLYTALSEIKEAYRASDSFNFEVHDLESPDVPVRVEALVDILNTLPFMSDRRVVVLRNSQKLGKKALPVLLRYLESPSPSSLLVILHLGTREKIGDMTAGKRGKVISLDIQAREIPAWLGQQAKRRGVQFTEAALEYLIGTVGTDLGMLSSEIEKCALWGAAVVDVDTLREVIYAGIEFSAFDLVEALGRKDTQAVFRIFEHLSKGVEPQMILGALNWHYTRRRPRPAEHGRGGEDLPQVFLALHEADAAVKTSRPCALEMLLMQLLKITPGQNRFQQPQVRHSPSS